MYYSKLFSTILLIILFTPSSDAFFSAFFQKIKNNILGEENEISGNDVVDNHQNNLEPPPINPNQFSEKNENFVTEKIGENKGEDEQQNKHLLGGYYDQKYQHFGFGGPKKEENIVKENEELNDKPAETEEIGKVEEGNEEENEEDRLFARIANWFKQNAAEILTKGKNFFKKGKKSETGNEEADEK
ncbi:unnamed protein product [Meloidogyne enterolobii]|uniref:Uncharacterized protein n=1 Tax=Meloidogyne enterolobii TaxID=390850 RepID=A0ACB1A3H8_MELEN